EIMKFDPKARKHVMYKETNIKESDRVSVVVKKAASKRLFY
ncbi:MAG: hypothetical protein JWP59_1011, partial [Massilia sp.]|nr:hypothetical protein [Massilia sp.]